MASDAWKGEPVERLPENRMGRDFVCGDIHGGWSLVREAMVENNFDPHRDRLICVGDLIDRGEASADFPAWLDAPWFYAVLGNHEQMAMRAVLHGDEQMQALWWMNGGGWARGLPPGEVQDLVERLAVLPLAIEVESSGDPVVVVHADIPGDDWRPLRASLLSERPGPISGREPIHSLLWERTRLMRGDATNIRGARHVFHGHTVLDSVRTLGNRTYIDTGSVMTGKLTLLDIGAWLEQTEIDSRPLS